MEPRNKFSKFSQFLLLIITFVAFHADAAKRTSLSLYFQDYPAGKEAVPGPDATVIPIAGRSGADWTYANFGTVLVTDDPVTESLNASSPEIGRLQGIYVTSRMDGSSLTLVLSVVFSNSKYNGSTIQLQGVTRYNEAVREASVTGGTGRFRGARGYALFRTVFRSDGTTYNVVRCDVTVQHY